jgi:hypothetical protein
MKYLTSLSCPLTELLNSVLFMGGVCLLGLITSYLVKHLVGLG